MTTLRQKEKALFRAYQAHIQARLALEPAVAALVGKTLKNRKSGKLFRVCGYGDAWHMLSVCSVNPKEPKVWLANPSEFTVVEEPEKIPEEIPGKFDENPHDAVFGARRSRRQ